MALHASWRIGVDVRDVHDRVIVERAIHVREVASTPDGLNRGVILSLEAAAGELALAVGKPLGGCSHLVLGLHSRHEHRRGACSACW